MTVETLAWRARHANVPCSSRGSAAAGLGGPPHSQTGGMFVGTSGPCALGPLQRLQPLPPPPPPLIQGTALGIRGHAPPEAGWREGAPAFVVPAVVARARTRVAVGRGTLSGRAFPCPMAVRCDATVREASRVRVMQQRRAALRLFEAGADGCVPEITGVKCCGAQEAEVTPSQGGRDGLRTVQKARRTPRELRRL